MTEADIVFSSFVVILVSISLYLRCYISAGSFKSQLSSEGGGGILEPRRKQLFGGYIPA